MQVIDGLTFESTFKYNSLGQLTEYFDPITEETYHYTYDANGNLTTKEDLSGTTHYSWDAENRLTKVKKPDGAEVEYKYNGEGKRVSKKVGDKVIKYIYDGWKIVKELDEQGSTIVKYTYYNEDNPISLTYQNQTYYYLKNGHGDVVGIADSEGKVIVSYTYNVWGMILEIKTDGSEVAEGKGEGRVSDIR